MTDPTDELLDYVLMDAYADEEQLSAFLYTFEELVRFPFAARVVGAQVEVVGVDLDGNERRGLVAHCRQGGATHTVVLSEVVPGPVPTRTRQLIAAYRRWIGVEPLPPVAASSSGQAWLYPPLAKQRVSIGAQLALRARGLWDPDEEYWGVAAQTRDPVIDEVVAAGPRPQFEMDQVIPGVDQEQIDDPIVNAADLHRVGHDREAVRILEALLAADERCIDAWAHLGLVAFDTRGPKAALPLYETGVAIGERSLPDGFGGVLPRALVDNRPFLRCLQGFGLCAWRQRRWDAAARVFTAAVGSTRADPSTRWRAFMRSRRVSAGKPDNRLLPLPERLHPVEELHGQRTSDVRSWTAATSHSRGGSAGQELDAGHSSAELAAVGR